MQNSNTFEAIERVEGALPFPDVSETVEVGTVLGQDFRSRSGGHSMCVRFARSRINSSDINSLGV
jgi:hypothetical protein